LSKRIVKRKKKKYFFRLCAKIAYSDAVANIVGVGFVKRVRVGWRCEFPAPCRNAGATKRRMAPKYARRQEILLYEGGKIIYTL